MNRFDIISKITILTHKPRWPLTGWQPLNWTTFQTLATQAKNSYKE